METGCRQNPEVRLRDGNGQLLELDCRHLLLHSRLTRNECRTDQGQPLADVLLLGRLEWNGSAQCSRILQERAAHQASRQNSNRKRSHRLHQTALQSI